jgi:hypothetical protein
MREKKRGERDERENADMMKEAISNEHRRTGAGCEAPY